MLKLKKEIIILDVHNTHINYFNIIYDIYFIKCYDRNVIVIIPVQVEVDL